MKFHVRKNEVRNEYKKYETFANDSDKFYWEVDWRSGRTRPRFLHIHCAHATTTTQIWWHMLFRILQINRDSCVYILLIFFHFFRICWMAIFLPPDTRWSRCDNLCATLITNKYINFICPSKIYFIQNLDFVWERNVAIQSKELRAKIIINEIASGRPWHRIQQAMNYTLTGQCIPRSLSQTHTHTHNRRRYLSDNEICAFWLRAWQTQRFITDHLDYIII